MQVSRRWIASLRVKRTIALLQQVAGEASGFNVDASISDDRLDARECETSLTGIPQPRQLFQRLPLLPLLLRIQSLHDHALPVRVAEQEQADGGSDANR